MASFSTLSIIIDAGSLGALCQAEPQHQWTQQQPAHAARVRLFLGCILKLPALSTPPPASGAPEESNCTLGR